MDKDEVEEAKAEERKQRNEKMRKRSYQPVFTGIVKRDRSKPRVTWQQRHAEREQAAAEQGSDRSHLRSQIERQTRRRGRDAAAIALLFIAGIATALVILSQQNTSLPAWVPIYGKDTIHLEGELAERAGRDPGPGPGGDDERRPDRADQFRRRPGRRRRRRHGRQPQVRADHPLRRRHPVAAANQPQRHVDRDRPGQPQGAADQGRRPHPPRQQPDQHPAGRVPQLPRRGHPVLSAAAAAGRRQGPRRRARPQALLRLPALRAAHPLHRQVQRRAGQAPGGDAPRRAQLPAADRGARPQRQRDPPVRLLLERCPAGLRQPPGGHPVGAARVPLDPAGHPARARRRQPVLAEGADDALGADSAGRGARAGPAGDQDLLPPDHRPDQERDPPVHRPGQAGAGRRRPGRDAAEEDGDELRQLARLAQLRLQRPRLQLRSEQARLPLLSAVAQPQPGGQLRHRRLRLLPPWRAAAHLPRG